LIEKEDAFLGGDLYVPLQFDGGEISSADAAYIHGTVAFKLRSAKFTVSGDKRKVEGEVAALDDNWDFKSNTMVAKLLNPIVAALFGPHH
jgi:hypothetical protein